MTINFQHKQALQAPAGLIYNLILGYLIEMIDIRIPVSNFSYLGTVKTISITKAF